MRCVLALLLLGLLWVQIRAQAFLNNQPISLPGVIEVENFDLGGEGVGYHDNEPANLGGAYRTTEGVDIGDCFDVGQGYSIGWTRAGEWLQYTVTIAQTANYTITVRYASASCGGALHFELDGKPITPSVSVNTTGSWQVWSTLTLSTPQLAAKSFAKLRLYLDANGPAGSVANLNYIQFAAVPVAAPAVPASPYNLQREYAGASFFDRFNFFTAADPTHGYVTYVDRTTASNTGLARVTPSGQAFMGVDNTTVAWGAGRRSVRIESSDTYNSGLFILDVAHMPTGCGTWPAYWLVGPNWPYAGEIDIFEGVHTQSSTSTTLHTNAGCSMYGVDANSMTGAWITRNCDVNAAGQYSNQGCGINGKVGSFGAPFNAAGGGVSATLWDATGIRIWFWQRGSAPADIAAGAPQPDRWGNPYARFNFGGECPASHFKNHFIVFNTALCGDWAGGNFGGNCPGLGSCTSYVQNNPWAFTQAYWLVNSLRVYQKA